MHLFLGQVEASRIPSLLSEVQSGFVGHRTIVSSIYRVVFEGRGDTGSQNLMVSTTLLLSVAGSPHNHTDLCRVAEEIQRVFQSHRDDVGQNHGMSSTGPLSSK